ncbi:MAG: NAD(P)/FAD-dependent oxidoreductase [Planctomycetia bacterium]
MTTLPATLTPEQAAAAPWDLVVVGAGLAGAVAAGLSARRGRRVLLVDRADFPRWKVCGCCLNQHALAALDEAGLGEIPDGLNAVPINRFRLATGGRRAELPLPGGVVLSREAFDAALIKRAVDDGAAFLPRVRAELVAPDKTKPYRTVRLHPAGGEADRSTSFDVTARIVVAANGFDATLYAEDDGVAEVTRPDARIGAGAVGDASEDDYAVGVVHMAVGRHGYVGLVQREDGRLTLAAAFDRDFIRRTGGPGSAAKAVLAEAGLPPVADVASLAWRGTAPLTRRATKLYGWRMLRVGDAAGYVEPFTGEGMAWALAGGVAVVPILDQGVDLWSDAVGERWADAYRRTIARRQGTCRVVTELLRRPRCVAVAVRLLGFAPFLAAPIVRGLNRPYVSTDKHSNEAGIRR